MKDVLRVFGSDAEANAVAKEPRAARTVESSDGPAGSVVSNESIVPWRVRSKSTTSVSHPDLTTVGTGRERSAT